jgi:hypothetical protein
MGLRAEDNLLDSWSRCPSGFGPISAEALTVFCNRILQSLNAVEDKESPQQEDNYSHCNGQKNEDLSVRESM